jgi:hypothetical protein
MAFHTDFMYIDTRAPLQSHSMNTSHFNIDLPTSTSFLPSFHILLHCYRDSSFKMSKDSSFRLCIAALLIIQIACWALALADLFVPGKPRLIVRTTMDVISQLFARRSAAMLQYRDFLAAF